MQGDKDVIAQLNIILKNELTAINQYFLHARMLKNWGILKLAEHEYDESIGEMKHADYLIERILTLDGLPNLQELGRIHIGESVSEILKADMAAETNNQGCLKTAIATCEKAQDYVSRQILVKILDETEEHIDWLEAQLGLIDTVGLQNYVQERMGGPEE